MKDSTQRLQPTYSLEEDRLNALKQILPEAFADGKINFDTLRELLGDDVEDERDEHFGLSWTGKREARRLAGLPSKGTLVPVAGEGVDEATTENIFIEGDNLEVLKLLHKSYRGKIKMIYIDPPYNTGNDFIYKDDYREPLESFLLRSGQMTEAGELLSSNPRSTGRFHSNWMNMIYPRLRVAKDLLKDEGVIFISIDDNEIHNLKQMMNEVFGEENFISQIIIQSNKRGQTYKEIAKTHEYLLIYSNSDSYTIGELEKADDSLPYEDELGKYDLWELRNRNPKFGRHNRPNLYYPIYVDTTSIDENGNAKISLVKNSQHKEVFPKNSEGIDSCWRWGKEKVSKAIKDGEKNSIVVARQKRDGDWNIYEKARKSTTKAKSIWDETEVISEQGTVELGNLGIGKLFDHPKPVALIKKALRIATDVDDFVIDFFGGSGTTAQAIMELNSEDKGKRKFICVQLPESTPNDSEARKAGYKKISDITKERIRRAIKKIKSESKSDAPLLQQAESSEVKQDLGFKVFRLERSNFRAWTDFTGQELSDFRPLLEAAESPFVPEASPDGILTEILLLEGFPLNSKTEIDPAFERNKVMRVSSEFSEHRLFITLDEEVWEETIDNAAELEKNDIFICLDNALSDENKVRLADVCRLKTI